MEKTTERPHLLLAIFPVIVLIGLLAFNVWLYGDNATGGPNQIALLVAAGIACILAMLNKQSWSNLLKGIVKSISVAMPSILILLVIGALAGTWLISGIVPAFIYYGLSILSPQLFLFAACIICALISLATGSSWSTTATIGIALMGIGQAMGVSMAMTAGAVISGAYFGDKMSPLSDTTNLAPAMAGADLFTHIRYMAYTTVPSISITLIIFLILGFTTGNAGDISNISEVQTAIATKFNINIWLFLVPLAVIVMIIKKVPALPALVLGTVLGGVFAIIFQPGIINEIAGEKYSGISSVYIALTNTAFGDVTISTGNANVDDLLSSSGMAGMLNTIWLILCAMVFGGAMETAGYLKRITQTIMSVVSSTGSLIASTAGTTLFFNATASDQYLAIVVPGRMFATEYKERGLAPENLSRTLEDAGTVTSVLIPWNTCGAYQSSILGVATGDYFMYCFFNLISPIMTMFFGFAGIKIAKLNSPKKDSQ